jgi:glycosyltransferase involved in cell wall biosynthesis
MAPRDTAISVVMPVYNALPYLDEAVQSILEQTCSDFEFVIYDDASTDGSWERLQQWARRDPRIRLFRGGRKLGPAASSNEVVRKASGSLIARMDADDISAPDRLERQSQVLVRNTLVGMVGSLWDVIDSNGRKLRGPEPWRLKRKSWFKPFPHGSIMFRRGLFDSIGGYRDECEFWEDFDFAIRASEKTRIMVLPQSLYRYRQSVSGTRIASDQDRVETAIDLRYRAIARLRRDRPYDDLLHGERRASDKRVDPRVFISLGTLALWSQQRPDILRRFLERARLRVDLATSIALLWVVWATVSPSTLRGIMSLPSRIRNSPLHGRAQDADPVEWKTPRRQTAKRDSKG